MPFHLSVPQREESRLALLVFPTRSRSGGPAHLGSRCSLNGPTHITFFSLLLGLEESIPSRWFFAGSNLCIPSLILWSFCWASGIGKTALEAVSPLYGTLTLCLIICMISLRIPLPVSFLVVCLTLCRPWTITTSLRARNLQREL